MITAALAAGSPFAVVKGFIKHSGRNLNINNQQYDLSTGRIFLVSVGKAAVPMAQAVIEVLGEDIFSGTIVCKKGTVSELDQSAFPSEIALYTASHPVSDDDSVRSRLRP